MVETKQVVNALSIDFEDWHHGMLQVDARDWPRYEDRINLIFAKLMRILDEQKFKATFFVLGYIADKYPDLIRDIYSRGHEVASHGYGHGLVYRQSRQEFSADVRRAKQAIEAVIHEGVKGYRAPYFSITRDSLWALEILKEIGFEYDSSIFPGKNFLYGIPDAPLVIHKAGRSGITEFPLSVVRWRGFSLPVCGGFYLRVMPYAFTRWGVRYLNSLGRPAIIYFHPWEIDAGKPKIRMKGKWKLIHEYNIDRMEEKLRRLLKEFSFSTVREVIAKYG